MHRILGSYIRLVPNLSNASYVDCVFSRSRHSSSLVKVLSVDRTTETPKVFEPTSQQEYRPRQYGTPRLPIELCEYIIDFLWDDIDALEACALTHPAFGVRCDYRVDDISRDTCLEDEVGLARLSKDLLASAAYSRYFGTIKIRVPEHSSWCYTVPLRLASRLTQLKQLELIGVFDSQKTHFSLSKHFGLFRTVTVLRLAECTFAAFADFARFIMSFPNLSTLDIVDVDWNQYLVLPHILGKSRSKKFRPKEIYVDLSIGRPGYLAQLVDWLVTTPAIKSAVTLYIEIRFAEDFVSLAKYLKASEETLIQLRVHTHPGIMEAAQISDNLCTESLTSLEGIFFNGVGLEDLPVLLSVLSHATRQLKRISLSIKSPNPEDLYSPDWDILEEYFSHDEFKNATLLFNFAILGAMNGRDDDQTLDLLERLPALKARADFRPPR